MVFSSFYHGQPLFPTWFCDRKLSFCDGSAETFVFYSCFFCGGKFRLSVCRFIKPLLIQPFAGLHSSTTCPILTQTRTCRGEAPPSCYARPFGRLKAPLGLSLLRCAAQTRACRMAGRAGSSHHQQRKTERSRRGTPCCTYRYRMWSLAGCALFRGAPCFSV